MTAVAEARRARRRRYAIRVALVIGAAAFLVVIGVSPVYAAASAVLVLAATVAWTGLPLYSGAPRDRRPARPGTRSDLARLATELRAAEARSEVALRVRELAQRRLARTGGVPRGDQLRALLDGDDRRIPARAVAVVLDELDRVQDGRGRRAS